MKIQARVLAMAEADVLGMISPRTIRDIKREDPNPKLMAFVVGQEGEARPKVVGLGATIQRWFRSAIEALTDRLPLGIAAYHDHAQTNDAAGRQPIGEIVGKALRHIEGALSAIAVAYIYPAFRALNLDVASIEANILIPQDACQFDVTDVDIKEVTGVALGYSANHSPAFPGATLLAQLQAFAEKETPKGETIMTLEEIKKAIQENKLQPSDVFASQVLISDAVVQERIEDMKDNLKMAGIRKLRESEEKVVALEAEKKTLAEKLSGHEKTIVKTQAKEAFDAMLTERPKLKEDPRLLKYVTKAFDRFQPTDATRLKDELNKFMDDQVKEYQDVFGEPKPGDKQKPKPEPEVGGDAGDDLLNPKNNELIPQ